MKKAILSPFTQLLTVYNPSGTSHAIEVCCHWLELYLSLKLNCKTARHMFSFNPLKKKQIHFLFFSSPCSINFIYTMLPTQGILTYDLRHSVQDLHSQCNLQTWRMIINILTACIESLTKLIQCHCPINIFLLEDTLGLMLHFWSSINKQHWPCKECRVTVYLLIPHNRYEVSLFSLSET